MRKYYVSGYMGEGAKRMFRDLESQEHVVLFEKIIPDKVRRVLFFRMYQLAKRCGRTEWVIRLCHRWYSVFRLPVDTEGCFVFVNSWFLCFYNSEMIQKLKKKYPYMKMVLYIVDPMKGFQAEDHKKVIDMMDLVYSAHAEDCEKYGYEYCPLVYSKEMVNVKEGSDVADEQNKSDLYYLGSGTDRTAFLEEIARHCRQMNIKTDFHVVSKMQKATKDAWITFHDEALSYTENEKMLQQATAILEIMHEGFQGVTQRYLEAVVYNKKLLTNNENIKKMEFYDSRYMKVFHSLEDIMKDFFEINQEVDYQYQGEFSPVHFISQIEARLSEDIDS